MRSSARANANRRNAKKSTGPRTAAGKERSSRNARSHGLSIPIACSFEFRADVEALTEALAGEGASARRTELARLLAEASIDVLRIRRAQTAVFADPAARVIKVEFGSWIHCLREFGKLDFELLLKPQLKEKDKGKDKEKQKENGEGAEKEKGKGKGAEKEIDPRVAKTYLKLQALLQMASSCLFEEDQRDMISSLPILLPEVERLERYMLRALTRRRQALELFVTEMEDREIIDAEVISCASPDGIC